MGFVLMTVFNVFFPHIISTILLKRYVPGTLTGILLNTPIGIYILFNRISHTNDIFPILITFIIVTVFSLILINLLFKIGKRIYD